MTGLPLSQLVLVAHLTATVTGIAAILLLTRRVPVPHWRSALLAAGCVALAIATFLASDPPRIFQDFRIAYYPAGRAALDNPGMLRALTGMGVSGFVNMPVVAYLFAPLAVLPMSTAMALFMISGLVATGLAWAVLARLAALDVQARWLLALLFAASGPLQYSVKEGNTSHFILLALAAGLALLRARRPAMAGALLGFAAIIKPPLLLFAVFFALRRDIRGLTGFAASCLTLGAASVALFGWSENLHWLQVCVLQFSHRWLAAFNVQSIPAFLIRFDAATALLRDWNSYPPPSELLLPARMLIAALFFLAGMAALNSTLGADKALRAARLTPQFLMVLCLSVLASPLSWSHYYCWLLMPTAFFLGSRARIPRWMRVCGWAAIVLMTPLVRPLAFSESWATIIYKDIGVSHLLFAGLLWFAVVAWQLCRSSTFAATVIPSERTAARHHPLPSSGYSEPSRPLPS
jgi:hypothetical protein